MFGGFELILYFLLVVIVLILYAINFSEHTLPRIREYIHLATAPAVEKTNTNDRDTHIPKFRGSSLRRRRRSLSYSRNNNSEEIDVRAVQQENINLNTKVKNLELQLCNLKNEKLHKSKEQLVCKKCETIQKTLNEEKIKSTNQVRQNELLLKENARLVSENDSMEKMLEEQQQIIKLALNRIIPRQIEQPKFCEDHKRTLYTYTDSILTK